MKTLRPSILEALNTAAWDTLYHDALFRYQSENGSYEEVENVQSAPQDDTSRLVYLGAVRACPAIWALHYPAATHPTYWLDEGTAETEEETESEASLFDCKRASCEEEIRILAGIQSDLWMLHNSTGQETEIFKKKLLGFSRFAVMLRLQRINPRDVPIADLRELLRLELIEGVFSDGVVSNAMAYLKASDAQAAMSNPPNGVKPL